METAEKKALKIYKYLSLLFLIVYWIYVVVDDYSLTKMYWKTEYLTYLEIWVMYFLIYFFGFSLLYWFTCLTIILIYYKLIKRN